MKYIIKIPTGKTQIPVGIFFIIPQHSTLTYNLTK